MDFPHVMAVHLPRLAFWSSMFGLPLGFVLLAAHVFTLRSLLNYVRRNHFQDWIERIGPPRLLLMGVNLGNVHEVLYFLFSEDSFFDPDLARKKKDARTWFSVFYMFFLVFGTLWWGAVMYAFGLHTACG